MVTSAFGRSAMGHRLMVTGYALRPFSAPGREAMYPGLLLGLTGPLFAYGGIHGVDSDLAAGTPPPWTDDAGTDVAG